MARKLKDADAAEIDGSPTKGHNIKARAKVISEAAHKVISLQAKRGQINEEIAEAKADVKALGIKMTAFNKAIQTYQLEDDKRDEAVEQLAECLAALGVTAQLDIFDDAKPQAKEAETAAAMH